jgi:hypothetical protein
MRNLKSICCCLKCGPCQSSGSKVVENKKSKSKRQYILSQSRMLTTRLELERPLWIMSKSLVCTCGLLKTMKRKTSLLATMGIRGWRQSEPRQNAKILTKIVWDIDLIRAAIKVVRTYLVKQKYFKQKMEGLPMRMANSRCSMLLWGVQDV